MIFRERTRARARLNRNNVQQSSNKGCCFD